MSAAEQGRVVEFAIGGMTCAACSTRLEKVLNRQAGMQANVNLAAERARIRLSGAADEAAVVTAVAKAGFTAEVVDGQTREREKAEKLRTYQSEIKRFWIAVLLTLPLVMHWTGMGWLQALLADIAVRSPRLSEVLEKVVKSV